jgi:hypothetical protein
MAMMCRGLYGDDVQGALWRISSSLGDQAAAVCDVRKAPAG